MAVLPLQYNMNEEYNSLGNKSSGVHCIRRGSSKIVGSLWFCGIREDSCFVLASQLFFKYSFLKPTSS